MNTNAGEGSPHTFHLRSNSEDTTPPFEARKHYVRIDAISWFVNKEGNFLKNFISSGTLTIKIANEVFDLGLGTFDLSKGMKVAPIFNRPIIEDRVYNGGDLTVSTSLGAIKRDTLLNKILKDLGKSTIEVANGAITNATIAGPAGALLSVGTSLTNSITEILNKGEKKVDFAIIEDTYQLSKLQGNENFILLHRGADIQKENFKLEYSGTHKVNLLYNDKPFEDGVWILLRISRVDHYSGVRPWFHKARETRTLIQNLIDNYSLGGLSREVALRQLTLSEQDSDNVVFRIMELISIIRNDFVLSFRDAMVASSEFLTLLRNARIAIEASDVNEFNERNKTFYASIKDDKEPNKQILDVLTEEFDALKFRDKKLMARTTSLEENDLWRSLKHTDFISKIA
ncbi:hypothetical protein GGR28_003173 [Lewinella aquimaris]|uniref:Uncharacterized protein n=1 Tax=Neolewinella aquimaris TaxID=1835722 RepID=A0A840EFF8_9BACT|nr:hypothetical protein [Neolewinella aquimaris]MBB4080539.1 hypothetical protein [Neolewinella aquimaris]